MPVDRRLREELAQAIAAFMRDRSALEEFSARVAEIHEQLTRTPAADADPAAAEIADDIRMILECGKCQDRFDSVEEWEAKRRALAFLRSDRSLPAALTTAAVEQSALMSGSFPPKRLAWTLLAAMLLSLAAWPWAGGYAFLAWWVISPIIWLFFTMEHHDPPPNPAWPFETDAQWREHEPLLADLNLPASWAASSHYRRPLPRWWNATLVAMGMGLLLLVLYLFIATIWPLYVIAMSLVRYDEPHAGDAAPAAH